MKKSFWSLMVFSMVLCSCGNLTDKEIESNTTNGVVLVLNRSYYEIILGSGHRMYFSKYDEEEGLKNLTFEKDSVAIVNGYGTGFFVSEDGLIATNAHVVANTTSERVINRSAKHIMQTLKDDIVTVYNRYSEKLENAERAYQYALTSDRVSSEDFRSIKDVRDVIRSEMKGYADAYNSISDMDFNDATIKYHNLVSIAYNNTYVTNFDDYESCIVKKVDTEHDLAIIQLKKKVTPEGKYIFEVPEENPLDVDTYSLRERLASDKNGRLYMTGFNRGPALAFTKEGIKSQFNSGNISQESNDKLLYSIPALHGSSGAPVVNMKGELVAINYAGLEGTQSFNYGIPVKYLYRLMEE